MVRKSRYLYYPDRPEQLTVKFAVNEYQKLLDKLAQAESSKSPSQWIDLYKHWNALGAYLSGESSRAHHEYNKHLNKKQLAARDRFFRERLAPTVTPLEHKLAKTLLVSRHKQAVAKRYGQQLLPVLESQIKPLDPINTNLRVRAGQLKIKYDRIIAAGTVVIKGQKVTLAKARALATSHDRDIRQATFIATSKWFLRNRPKLAGIYDELVEVRTQMAKNLGYDSYTPLGYLINGHKDYDEKQVDKFRAFVRKHIVPIRLELLKQQAKSLGLKNLKPWDAAYNPETTLPLGIAPAKSQLTNAQKLFDKLSPTLAKHFKFMRTHRLIDLENRPHKWASAYCTSFADSGEVAVLCSSTGDPDDVRVLMHEMGHAFQKWQSNHIEAIELQWGTSDLAEIYSFGMEFLSLNYIDIFFDKENAEKYRLSKWEDAIMLLCYACVVDEFQHWVYANPKASIAARDKAWKKITNVYTPGVDWSGYEKFCALRWYAQNHIFNAPFYYIDYALATTAAVQLGIEDSQDHKKTLKKYLKMCRLGGTKGFLSAVEYSGFKSPFDEKTIKELATYSRDVLLR